MNCRTPIALLSTVVAVCLSFSSVFADPPAMPGNVSATLTNFRYAMIQWQDNSTNALSFRIEKSLNPDGPWKSAGSAKIPMTQRLVGLKPETTNYFHVAAVNKSGPSAFTDPIVLITPPPPDTKAPTVKFDQPAKGALISETTNLIVVASDNQSLASVNFYADAALIGIVTNAPYLMAWDSTTVANGPHTLTAQAVDASGNSRSNSVSVTVTNMVSPSNLIATSVSPTSIQLTWQSGTNTNSVYPIERAQSPNGPWTTIAVVGSDATSFIDTDVQPQSSYFYRVRACDGCTPTL